MSARDSASDSPATGTGRGRGRRPGGGNTKDTILAAASRAFASRGYDAATVREIAADAGVDPAMIAHYFGSKEQLFLAVVNPPLDPATVIRGVADGPLATMGERLVSELLNTWDSPAGKAGLALMRTAVQHEWSARLLRELVLTRILRPVIEAVEDDPERARWRASLAATQLSGLILIRYVLRLEPIASAPTEQVVAQIGPVLQHYLTGAMPH